jgi:hypothetical protein
MTVSVREPVVAGAFYPRSAAQLGRELDQLLPSGTAPHPLLACVAPHAGYIYSGRVAGELYGHLEVPRRVVVLGPNHTGLGAPVAVAPDDAWSTPLGPVPVDRELAALLLARHPDATSDPGAHRREHSIEVQLPFLLRRRPDVTVLPVCLKHLGYAGCERLGESLAVIADELGEPLGVVASSDMTHYQPDAEARDLDHRAIVQMLARDPAGLYETVHREGISMCGVVPATVALVAARLMGATSAHLSSYATSGDVSGDRGAVVGYAGVCFVA